MAVKGIDVSRWQGDVDFEKVRAAGYDFVIINAGYGMYISQKDKYFDANYEKARAAGLGVVAYWYSYALSAAQAKEEAKVFLKAVGDRSFEYPLCFDIEDSSQSKLSSTLIGQMCDAFCSYLEDRGYYAAIYSYANFLENKVPAQCKRRYDVWVAAFDVARPPYSGTYGMWQYSSHGSVSGVSGDVDLDYAYKDYPAIMREKGLNGFKGGKSTLDSNGFKKGDRSEGVLALKQLLILAKQEGLTAQSVDNNDGFGSGTEKAVNALLGDWGYAENGIAGGGFIKRLGRELGVRK
ncbi:MAG: glycoside hydrolase family 25 protein [Ruminococcus sp.]|nr:glycoside hydrolase family 25 protein [Ruminococcus sp.]